jgi:hypothetical protein
VDDSPDAPAAEDPVQGFGNSAKDGWGRGKAKWELAVHVDAAIPGNPQKRSILRVNRDNPIGVLDVDFGKESPGAKSMH